MLNSVHLDNNISWKVWLIDIIGLFISGLDSIGGQEICKARLVVIALELGWSLKLNPWNMVRYLMDMGELDCLFGKLVVICNLMSLPFLRLHRIGLQ